MCLESSHRLGRGVVMCTPGGVDVPSHGHILAVSCTGPQPVMTPPIPRRQQPLLWRPPFSHHLSCSSSSLCPDLEMTQRLTMAVHSLCPTSGAHNLFPADCGGGMNKVLMEVPLHAGLLRGCAISMGSLHPEELVRVVLS